MMFLFPCRWSLFSLHSHPGGRRLPGFVARSLTFQNDSLILRNEVGSRLHYLTCFHACFFPFCPLCQPPLFPPFSRHLFAPFSPLKSALLCRAKGTVQSLERVSFRMDLCPKFGKEIPSRNPREKRSVTVTLHNFCGVN